ncbi:hypothetical protein KI688_008773 [Linnemannia hyalina]|uniref:Uncharacterized protein n=1 Tax=Linnemannia hyalina TaxID=64524 RepID=A0A9P8BXD5_9FUNG|nr:hypothetical protein KI688_008773 [Linnemannia hyalina]
MYKRHNSKIYTLPVLRYDDLLKCARTGAPHSGLLFPHPGVFVITMVRTYYTLLIKLELQWHMRVPKKTNRSEDKSVVTLRNFGEYIGYDISRTTLSNFIRKEIPLRQVADLLPVESKCIVNRKNRIVEEVLVLWLEDQRSRHVPVDGKINEAAQVTYAVAPFFCLTPVLRTMTSTIPIQHTAASSIGTPQEQQETIQFSRRNDYEQEARLHFEHLIVGVSEANDWNWIFISTGTKDAEDLAEESLSAEPVMKGVISEPALLPVSSPVCTAPYDTDERASSPLADNVYTRGIQIMKHKAPALGLMEIGTRR